MAVVKQTGQETVEKKHFAGCSNDGVVDGEVGGEPGVVKVMGGVADETELGEGVAEFLLGDLFFCGCQYRSRDV